MKRHLPLLLVLLIAAQSAPAQTTFHGNVARTGAYESAGLKQLSGVKWSFKTDGAIVSSPVVDRGEIYFGSTDGFLYALK